MSVLSQKFLRNLTVDKRVCIAGSNLQLEDIRNIISSVTPALISTRQSERLLDDAECKNRDAIDLNCEIVRGRRAGEDTAKKRE